MGEVTCVKCNKKTYDLRRINEDKKGYYLICPHCGSIIDLNSLFK